MSTGSHFGLHALLVAYLLEGAERTKPLTAQEFNISADQAGKYLNEMVRQKLMIPIGPESKPTSKRGVMPERFIPTRELMPNLKAIAHPNYKEFVK